MPRRARIQVPGLPLHVWQRGHNKMPCFADANDHLLYLALLRESALLYPTAVHAYVLMTNHVHLLVTPSDPPCIARLMKRLNERYARHFNEKNRRSGSLWEGRFKSSIVDTDAYLLELYRYIELNPVRAGLCARPGDYPWSSHRANAYGQASNVLTPHSAFLATAITDGNRMAAYRRFVALGTPEEALHAIRLAAVSNTALARESFLTSLPHEARRTPKPPGRPKNSKREEGQAAGSARRETGYVPV